MPIGHDIGAARLKEIDAVASKTAAIAVVIAFAICMLLGGLSWPSFFTSLVRSLLVGGGVQISQRKSLLEKEKELAIVRAARARN